MPKEVFLFIELVSPRLQILVYFSFRYASSVSLSAVPGKPKQKEILIQVHYYLLASSL
jgi:hypothetical protein